MAQSNSHWVRFSAFVLAVCLASVAYPFSEMKVRWVGNIVVADGRAFFWQPCGSLTAIEIATGDVAVRKTDEDLDGRLMAYETGIALRDTESLVVCDSDVNKLWSADGVVSAGVGEGYVVYNDETGRLTCRRASSGAQLWTRQFPGRLQIVIRRGMMLVFRSGTTDEFSQRLVVLGADTGEAMLEANPPAGRTWLWASLLEQRVYVALSRGDDEEHATLAILDVDGSTISSHTATFSAAAKDPAHWAWTFDRKVLTVDGVRPLPPGFSDERLRQRFGYYLLYPIAPGLLIIGEPEGGDVESRFHSVRSQWCGRAPQLLNPLSVEAVASAEDAILVGSTLGQVECIDADTGLSRWVYLFPVLYGASYFAPFVPPPYYAERAAEFRRENAKRTAHATVLVERNGRPVAPHQRATPRVVRDPEPCDPFTDLPLLLTMAWACAVSPFALLGFGFRRGQWSEGSAVALGYAAAIVMALPCLGLLTFWNLALSSTVGVVASAGLLWLIGLWGLMSAAMDRRWLAGAGLAAIIAVETWFFIGTFAWAWF
ncbi:MAG: PQQ-binding-like beta-propeller repeat protein [Armatimonadota bacterium]|nr:PQQ-binding-like beta-propeller repeat protein [Armatimonadota bacterium]